MQIVEYNELGRKPLFFNLDPIEARIKIIDLFQEFYTVDGDVVVTDDGFTVMNDDVFSQYRIEEEQA